MWQAESSAPSTPVPRVLLNTTLVDIQDLNLVLHSSDLHHFTLTGSSPSVKTPLKARLSSSAMQTSKTRSARKRIGYPLVLLTALLLSGLTLATRSWTVFQGHISEMVAQTCTKETCCMSSDGTLVPPGTPNGPYICKENGEWGYR